MKSKDQPSERKKQLHKYIYENKRPKKDRIPWSIKVCCRPQTV